MFEKPKDFDPYGDLSLNLFVGSVWKQCVEGKGPYTDDIWNCRGVDPVDANVATSHGFFRFLF